MNTAVPPDWLLWAREIQALAQTGCHYAVNEYQRERYHRLNEIAAEMVASQSGVEAVSLADAFHAQIGYATPRVDVRGAVFQDGKLLLVQERSDGGWTLPGGWADVGELPSEADEREVWQETGLHVKACRVIGVYDANRVGPLEIFHAFKKLAESFGVSGCRAKNPDDLKKALEGALEKGGPCVIEVPVDKGSEPSPWNFIYPQGVNPVSKTGKEL